MVHRLLTLGAPSGKARRMSGNQLDPGATPTQVLGLRLGDSLPVSRVLGFVAIRILRCSAVKRSLRCCFDPQR
jgi:hypothetical protein